MFRPVLAFAVIAVSFMFSTAPAKAEGDYYNFDKSHTQIMFFVNHLGFSMQQGEFHDYTGHFVLNQAKPEESYVEIAIEAASIDMDSEKWEEHMKNQDFFNVEKYPLMTFKSTKIEVTGDNKANVTGDFTLLGITKPVTLAVTLNKAGRHPFNEKYVAGFSATATIKRSEFGMNYGLPLIGDNAEIRIEIEGVREDKEGQEFVNP